MGKPLLLQLERSPQELSLPCPHVLRLIRSRMVLLVRTLPPPMINTEPDQGATAHMSPRVRPTTISPPCHIPRMTKDIACQGHHDTYHSLTTIAVTTTAHVVMDIALVATIKGRVVTTTMALHSNSNNPTTTMTFTMPMTPNRPKATAQDTRSLLLT